MAGWYPPIEAHELDTMGELGKRIAATIELKARPDLVADLKDKVADLKAELMMGESYEGAAFILRAAIREALAAPRLPKTVRILLEEALKDA